MENTIDATRQREDEYRRSKMHADFASSALNGIYASPSNTFSSLTEAAWVAWEAADAMMAEYYSRYPQDRKTTEKPLPGAEPRILRTTEVFSAIKFNLNEGVCVRLTDAGRKRLPEIDAENGTHHSTKLEIDGWTLWIGWEIFGLFGRDLWHGGDEPFEMSILLGVSLEAFRSREFLQSISKDE